MQEYYMSSGKTKPASRPPRARRGQASKKTLNLDQALLDRARRTLGARTETDTITQALEVVVRRGEQIQGLRALAALGPIDRNRIDG
jgi:Arc/MetJ family transcription regulator